MKECAKICVADASCFYFKIVFDADSGFRFTQQEQQVFSDIRILDDSTRFKLDKRIANKLFLLE